eukprot:jgi/Botrbrau1/19400/Bobra.0338s0028.1
MSLFGFDGTPVTRALLAVVVSLSAILLYTKTTKQRFGPFLDLFLELLVFRHPGELIFGTILLWYFKLFERQLGPAKYAGFALATLLTPLIGQIVLSKLLHWPRSSGPFSLIYANFVTFVLDVPPMQSFSVLGWRFTEKAFPYLGGIHLLLLTSGKAVPAATCGILFSIAYRWNVLGLRSYLVPTLIDSWLSKLLNPLLGGEASTRLLPVPPGIERVGRPTTSRATRPQASVPVPQAHSPSRSAPRAPPSEALSQLVSMGFDPAKAAQALQQSNNEVESALSLLLN